MQKSVVFLYINKLSKKETNPIYNSIKKVKYLRTNLTKDTQKSLNWKLQNINEWNWRRHKLMERYLYWTGRIIIVKIRYYTKWSIKSCYPHKNFRAFLTEIFQKS